MESIIQLVNEVAMNYSAQCATRLLGSRSWYFDGLQGRVKRLSNKDWEHHLYTLFTAWENAIMSEKNKNKGEQAGWNDIEFVNITLLSEDKEAYDTWLSANQKSISALLGDVMADQYRVSCVWDDKNECFIATFTGKKDQKYNANRSLSSRSDNWWDAICLCVYKHTELSSSRKWSGSNGKNNWG